MGWMMGSMMGSRTIQLTNLKNGLIHSYFPVIGSLI